MSGPGPVELQLKICGLRRLEDARLALEIGATHLGFVFAPASKRDVEAPTVASIVGSLRASETRAFQAVGVFQGHDIGSVLSIAAASGIDAIQLHGGYDASDARAAQDAGYTLIWAIPVESDGTWSEPADIVPDVLLLDVASAKGFGGTGATFDWQASRRPSLPFWIAGGLRPDNVEQAVRALRPNGVDLSSGVELSPGVKSAAKLLALSVAIAGLHRSRA